jgi:hypothetical protein
VQPAFQTLTRGITWILHDLLGRHTSGAIQLHSTTTLLLTEHRILSFNLQENVRSPLPRLGLNKCPFLGAMPSVLDSSEDFSEQGSSYNFNDELS